MASFGTGEVRVVALVGPYQSGKTSLLESILVACGSLARKTGGSGAAGRLHGDSSPEARARSMGVEVNIAEATYLGERYVFLDCPGSIEFFQETLGILPGVDAAVIVAEPDPARIHALSPVFQAVQTLGLPHFVVFNKIDKAAGSIRAASDALTQVSAVPVLLRHIPLRENGQITGFVDLAAGRAHIYRPGQPSEVAEIPDTVRERYLHDRTELLEKLADFDDSLMEELLDNIEPSRDTVFRDLALDVQQGKIVPVFLTAAALDEGTRRFLKALRHELPAFAATQARLGVAPEGGPLALALKTFHTPHAGKISACRVLRGGLREGDVVGSQKLGGVFRLGGTTPEKLAGAQAGDFVGIGKLEGLHTGDTLGEPAVPRPPLLAPVYSLALAAANRGDEVKLTAALARLAEEDPSLTFGHDPETGELVLRGQGEMHLNVAIDRLKSRYGLTVQTRRPQTPYRETIRKGVRHHARHKKQSGGHGQFADVTVEVRPLPPGSGFQFSETITGGAIPRQYIPAVEEGAREGLKRGPLGFPVVDVGVTLVDGKFHTVDSSDMAFQIAGRMAMQEVLPQCAPVLLEPVLLVRLHVPSLYTAKANQVVSTRRGQILGFDARPGWPGWDTVEAHIPQSEMHDLIIELRSLTEGAGTYEAEFHHRAELVGRLADAVVQQQAAAE
ncbi:elongation factor G [Pedomonas sp. V897]|mgnify:FL=1|uniref:elongation factor G n=1 Tax=Pedomonas sp. V897 TaxID=3446482 RepID=UPI003EE183F2